MKPNKEARMKISKITNVQPRNVEIHGLFGVKFLKHHQMRDDHWTAQDLIEQFEHLSDIYAKDNEVKKLQREKNENIEAEMYRKLKKEKKDKIEAFKVVLRGDVQRMKNILMNFPIYMKIYQNKQSFEVLEELDFKSFNIRKRLDRRMAERKRLMHEYEARLVRNCFIFYFSTLPLL